MSDFREEWRALSWFCPNCAERLIGFTDARGFTRAECRKCHSVSVRKVMGRRHNRIEIYAPKGQETLDHENPAV
jgi:hypothetical protein